MTMPPLTGPRCVLCGGRVGAVYDTVPMVQVLAERNAALLEIVALRTALCEVRKILASDTVEYDDVRNVEQIIDAALEPPKTST